MAQIPFVIDAVQEQKDNPSLEELQASMCLFARP